MVKLVWCTDSKGGIARGNMPAWDLPAAEERFDAETVGTVVVTAGDALPWRPLLPKRTNVVLARGGRESLPPGAVPYGSLPQVLKDFAGLPVCVAGGRSALEAALPEARELTVITLDKAYGCDDFFKPDLSAFVQERAERADGFRVLRYRRADAPALDPEEAAADESFRLMFENYAGPFDVLLTLIHDKRMDVMRLDLADLTAQYLAYIKDWSRRAEIEQLSDYLVMATYLVELKSKKMVPDPDAQRPDEDLSDDKERDRLIRRLIEYKHYREALPALEELQKSRAALFAKDPDGWEALAPAPDEIPEAPLPEYVSPNRLRDALGRVFARERVKLLSTQKIVVQELSVEEVSDEVEGIVAAIGERASLTRVLNRVEPQRLSDMYFVTCFVALLVLARNGVLLLEQFEPDGEIYVSIVPESERRAAEETPEQMVARQEALRAETERLVAETRKQRAAEHFRRREEFLKRKFGGAYVSRDEYRKMTPEQRAELKERQRLAAEKGAAPDGREKGEKED